MMDHGENIAPLIAEALAMLPEPHRTAVATELAVRSLSPVEARARRLVARDAALRAAAALMPAESATGRARALAAALAQAAQVRGETDPDDAAGRHVCCALMLNEGDPLGWRRLRDIIAGD